MIAAAVKAGTSLPEAERIHLQLSGARHAGDRAKAVELSKSVAELLPMAWHAQYEAASALWLTGRLKEAKAVLQEGDRARSHRGRSPQRSRLSRADDG